MIEEAPPPKNHKIIIKEADILPAYLKWKMEVTVLNHEFPIAEKDIETILKAIMNRPEVKILDTFSSSHE